MPAVSLVIAITLGAFALQIERMKLVGVAAMAARAIARGETAGKCSRPSFRNEFNLIPSKINFEIQTRENTVCVNLSRNFEIAGTAGQAFRFLRTAVRSKGGALKFGERGSGTILALAMVSLAICLFSLSQIVALNLISQQRLQGIVDAMAVAAADSLRGLNTGFPCPTAGQIGAKCRG